MKPIVHFLITIASILAAILLPGQATAQIAATDSTALNSDSIRAEFDRQPYFGIYKDNYFTFGVPVNHRPSSHNSNVKIQISIAQRLTKSTLPGGTYLFLFYSQKVFWNVLEKSMPMTDINFNPGLGLVKPLFVKNRFIGKVSLLAEHESNGRDGVQSRSWNKISLAANIMIEPNFIVHGKAWIPIVDGGENRDILDYSGIYQMGTQMFTNNRRFGAAVTMVKRRGWALNYNVIVELNYRLFKNENQYLFAQYYNGYGEGLLEYKVFHNMFRVGIVIKPRIFSDY